MNTPIYQVRGLVHEYTGRRVLQVEYLDIFRGEVLALIGPSGAGKSTLLRLLNFLEAPTAGSIYFCGYPFSRVQPLPLDVRRRVTMVFQRPALLRGSVEANVRFGLHLRGCRRVDEAVRAALAEVRLLAAAKRRAATLSGGEAQRVALARALVLKPDVLLLDEPTANLDPYNVGLIEEIVRRLNREEGTTIVLVTHNVFQARRLAQRAALLLEGRVVEIAAGEQFFDNPQDPRTAAFVRGEMIY